ncbi:MAG: DinB family protein, partial [Dehalococcoidia bacterium]
MDILDRLLGHDAWTGRVLLLRCQELSEAQLDQPFDAGLGSVRATLEHTIGNVETWTALIAGGPLPEDGQADSPPPSVTALLARHDAASAAFRSLAQRLAAEGRLDDLWV